MSLPNGEAGLAPGIQFGVSGDGSLAGLATRTQDNVSDVLKQQMQGSAGWGSASSILFSGLSPDGKTPFPVLILKAILGALYTAINDVSSLEHSAVSLIETVLQDGEAVVEDVLGAFEALGKGIGNFFAGLLGLLGGPPAVNTGGGTATPNTPQTLQQLAGYLGTSTPLPASVLSTVKPGASPNVQPDSAFTSNFASGASPFGDVQGHGQWFWDGYQGPNHPGSVRTKRSGLVTVFWLTGTYQVNNTNPPADIREYWLTPDASFIKDNSFAVSGEGFNQGIDAQFFEFVPVFYGACMFPMKSTITQGTLNLVQQIKATPGPFILTGWSQGAHVISNVYDLLRYGKYNDGGSSLTDLSMMDRRQDLLAGIALGNPRRQQGWTFPELRDPVPGNAGVNSVRLADCEPLWWEMTAAGDPASSVPLTGDLGGWMRLLWNAIVERGNAGGSEYIAAIEDFLSSGDWVRLIELIVDPFEIPVFIAAVETFFQLGVHDSYWLAQPLAGNGDIRTFGEIACDYINSFAYKAHPVEGGQRRQFVGTPFAVDGDNEEVIVAGASVMWENIVATGEQISVAVNAYDVNNKLIGRVDAFDIDGNPITAIVDPEPSSNFEWVTLQAEFAMPAGAKTACLLFDVAPEAMILGKVWFGASLFEVTNLFAGALVNSTGLMLGANQVVGALGEADMLTAQLNYLNGLASAATGTNITGAQLSTALNAIGQVALNAQQALLLSISNAQVLSPANRPHYETGGLVGDVTFPQSDYGGAVTTVASGTTIAGLMTCQQAGGKKFIEFLAKNVGAGSGVYINTYAIDPTTGAWANTWTSPDISSSLSTGSVGVVAVFIDDDDAVPTTVAELVAVEIVVQSTSISVGTANNSYPNKTSVPPNWGATRTTSTSGGVSPSSLTQSQFSFGATRPFILFGTSDVIPIYQAPNQWMQENAGLYRIPLSANDGDLLDAVALAAGGGGGAAHVGSSGILGIGATPTTNGQGGQCGAWATQEFVYGTDIPLAVTELIGIIGAAGPIGVAGGDTILGYGLNTPAFDAAGDSAVGSGSGGAESVVIDWGHLLDVAATAVVVPAVVLQRGSRHTVAASIGDTPLALLGGIQFYTSGGTSFGQLFFFGLIAPPTGEQQITLAVGGSAGSSAYVAATSLSYKDVSSFGPVLLTRGTTTSATQTVASDDAHRLVQAFASIGASFSGYSQTQRYAVAGSAHNLPMIVGDALGDTVTNFAATSSSPGFGGAALVLNPTLSVELLRAPGGPAGGAAGHFNAANSNTTIKGIGPGHKQFEGRLYVGGGDVVVSAYPGNKPGGGGTAGTAGFPTGYPGADGMLSVTTKQGSSGTISGIGGGGGSELSVTYEATGLGSETTTSTELGWTHASDGGPTCGVVLYGAVLFSNGEVDVECLYGSAGFDRILASDTYYNAAGSGLFLFVFGLIGPASGSQTVAIETSGTATIEWLSGGSVSYQNVGDFGNFITNSGHSNAPSIPALTASAGQMVIGGFAGNGHVLNSFTQTSRWSQTNLASLPMVIGDASGPGSVAFGASTSAVDYWGAASGLILPVS